MKNKKYFILVLLSAFFSEAMIGCSTVPDSEYTNMVQIDAASPQISNESTSVLSAFSEDSRETDAEGNDFVEQFKIYEPFGMVYDMEKNELYYNGKTVRWFEDYYPLADGAQAGRDFFNEKGIVDVYAVRDFSSFVRADDGSFDPGGKLTGLEEFSEEEFADRNLDAIKNPAPIVTMCGEPASAEELQKMAEEYGLFGVTYNAEEGEWYFQGEKVRYFQDILTSNGESLTGGKFHGTMRTLGNDNGIVDIYTVRDYDHLNSLGYGTLTGIEKYSQEEFDERTRSSAAPQSSSGICVVVQE